LRTPSRRDRRERDFPASQFARIASQPGAHALAKGLVIWLLGAGMEFRILGPLEVWVDGAPAALGGPKQRALLAMLLLRANEVVSRDALIDGLWGELPPVSAGHTLEAYVHRLRKVLRNGAAGEQVLVTRAPGYLLCVGPDELDLDRFERLVQEGRRALATGAPERAADTLRQALSLWRGPPLGDLESEPFAHVELQRIAELRQDALEERIEADLACGRHRALVPELQALVARFPLRERLRGQLMLALHRSGRQADALEAYRDARRYLVVELGLEPGAGLRAIQQAILCQDPAVEAQAEAIAAPVPRRRLRAAAVLAAIAIAPAVLASAFIFRDQDTSGPAVRGDALVSVDSGDAAVRSAVALDSGPSAVAAGFGSLWVAEFRRNTVARVDAEGRVVQTIRVGSGPSGIAAGAGAVWVANHLDGTLSRIDPATQEVVQTIDVSGAPVDVAVAGGAVWAAADHVVRIDARTGKVVRMVAVGGRPSALAVGAGSVWVSGADARTVSRVDPRTNSVAATIRVGGGAGALAFGADRVWVANSLDGTISRVDPAHNAVTATLEVGNGPAGIAVAGGKVWVANEFGGSLVAVDPRRGAIVRAVRLDGRPGPLAPVGGRARRGPQPSRRDAGAAQPRQQVRLDRPGDPAQRAARPTARHDQQWTGQLQARRRPRRHAARARPRHLASPTSCRRPDLHLPAQGGHPPLKRRARTRRGHPPRHRARIQAQGRGSELL
jgi:YVTN family beta-propeller protein